MKVLGLDHIVIPVRSMEAALAFYEGTLGMRREVFGDGRFAVHFGSQKFNLHRHGAGEADLVADMPEPGSQDFCLIVESVSDALADLRAAGVDVIAGPIGRTGAVGPIMSVYCRDPEGNLVELAEHADGPVA